MSTEHGLFLSPSVLLPASVFPHFLCRTSAFLILHLLVLTNNPIGWYIIFYVSNWSFLFRVCWPLEWSLSRCLLLCPCLQSLACTQSLWSASHVQLATSQSMVTCSTTQILAGISVDLLEPLVLCSAWTGPLFSMWTQVTTRQCSVWPATACWRACLLWRAAAVWWRSFLLFLASSSARHSHGQNAFVVFCMSHLLHYTQSFYWLKLRLSQTQQQDCQVYSILNKDHHLFIRACWKFNL